MSFTPSVTTWEQKSAIGLQTALDVPCSAANSYQLSSYKFSVKPTFKIQHYGEEGNDINSRAVIVDNYTVINFEAKGVKGTELSWIFLSLINNESYSQSSTNYPNKPALYTFYHGDKNNHIVVPNCYVNSISIRVNRDSFTISGEMIGSAFTKYNSIYPVTNIFDAATIINYNSFDLYIDGSPISNIFNAEYSINNRWNAYRDASGNIIEIIPNVIEGSFKFTTEYIVNTLWALETTTPKELSLYNTEYGGTIKMGGIIDNSVELSDEDGVYAMRLTYKTALSPGGYGIYAEAWY